MESPHSVTDWIANIVLMSVGYFCRLAFGNDHLTGKQMAAFFVFCGGVVWIVDKLPVNQLIKLSVMLVCGLIMPNIITGIISGAKSSEPKISKKVEKNIENISNKVSKISDAITDSDKPEKS